MGRKAPPDDRGQGLGHPRADTDAAGIGNHRNKPVRVAALVQAKRAGLVGLGAALSVIIRVRTVCAVIGIGQLIIVRLADAPEGDLQPAQLGSFAIDSTRR